MHGSKVEDLALQQFELVGRSYSRSRRDRDPGNGILQRQNAVPPVLDMLDLGPELEHFLG